MRKQTVEVATVILAGGEGTRLKPLTQHHSKPAVCYGGRYRLIDVPISNAINSGLRQIFVIAQCLSAELEHHVSQTYRFDAYNPGSIDVLTPQINEKGEKEWFLGTADAVRKTLPTLLKSSAEYFLILSGDQLYNIDFQEMIQFAQSKQADLTIASIEVKEKEARRMGLLATDDSQYVVDFVEKPKGDIENFRYNNGFLGSMGMYIFKREALIWLLEKDPRHDFGYHLITTAVEHLKTATFTYAGYWEDIGTVASYYEANLLLTRAQGLNIYDEHHPIYTRPTFLPGPKIHGTKITESIISDGCIIEAAEISHSIIGLRSYIKKGTIIRDTVMLGNHFYMPPLHGNYPTKHDYWIGEHCHIEKTIIDEHVQIGHNVKLLNQARHTQYDGEGIFVRDGIIIVTAGTKLPNNFTF